MQLVRDLASDVRERILASESYSLEPGAAVEEALHGLALRGSVIADELKVRNQLRSELFEMGVLQPLLDDSSIEELWVNRPNEVIYARGGSVHTVSLDLDAETIRTLVLRMLRSSGRRIDTSLPFADAILDDGSRLHVVIPDVTARHWALNIRKFPPEVLTMADLEKSRMVTPDQVIFLTESIRAGKNILISGATHTGKTTMLAALLNELDSKTRLVSCEETFELRTNLHDWVAMQARQPNLEGQGEIPLRRLVKESLRMRPDRLVIGEVREAEALDLLVAMNSGVSGACTIHANSASAAITKLCTLPLLAGPNISAEFVRQTVAEAVDLVVHCEYLQGGHRRVSEIANVHTSPDGRPQVEVLTW